MCEIPGQTEDAPDPEKKWRIDWLALAAPSGFILSIVSLLTRVLVSPLAIVVCSFGLFRNRRGFAITGIVLSLLALSLKPVPRASYRSPVSRVLSDMRSIGTALESYYVDHGAYPRGAPFGELSAEEKNARKWRFPLPPPWSLTDRSLTLLTTPVAYLTSIPYDVLRDDRHTFQYYADEGGWILISPGPDGDYDLDAPNVYVSSIAQPSETFFNSGVFDPTNGVTSNGDVFRVRQ